MKNRKSHAGRSDRRMHPAMLVIAVLAALLFAYLLATHGEAVGRSLLVVGWGLVPVLVVHGIQVGLSAAAWRAAASPFGALPPLRHFVVARWIREGVNALLPVAQIGGEVVGARYMVLHGVKAAEAGAQVTVDLTIEAVTQIVFTLVGLAYLLGAVADSGLVRYAFAGVLLFAPMLLLLLGLQHRGGFAVMAQLVSWFGGRWADAGTKALDALYAALRFNYRHPRALLRGVGLHLLSWFAGTAEIWVAAHAMNVEMSLGDALILESLGQAVRSAAFFVPAGLGIQETGFALIAAHLGLGAETGLALSLVKRLRELALGGPALFAMHVVEGRGGFDSAMRLAPPPERSP